MNAVTTSSGPADSPAAPDEGWVALVTEHLALADHLAGRFRDRGEPVEDLRQVARLGLVLAARRYAPSSPVPFAGFAVPSVLGELRRHFRDHLWVVRPPRRLQELRPRVVRAQESLTHDLGRTPTVHEVAAQVAEPLAEVIEALCLGTAYSPHPLDADEGAVAETLGAPDVRLEQVEDRLALRPVLSQLPDRCRAVLRLHYIEDQTQQEIAGVVGVSQMQVSRMLRQSLETVRRSVQRST